MSKPYEDRSYPPISPNGFSYVRGDGARVTITIEGGTGGLIVPPSPQVAVPPPVITNPFTLFDVPSQVTEPASTSAAAPPPVQLAAPLEGQLKPATMNAQAAAVGELYDNPIIGGKYTVFVLLYGPARFAQMHRRCLESIIGTVPAGRLDLRVGSNELCEESVRFVEGLVDKGVVTKHYRHRTNDKKYPVMREMFWDDSCPITTKWLLWFDDDSIADRDRLWLHKLTSVIIEGYGEGKHLFGDHRVWELKPGQGQFIRERPWYKSRQFRDMRGNPAPNGNKIHFAAGGFWAMSVEAMRACDVPDTKLQHNGGDYMIGEQLWQNGFGLRKWNSQKQFIHTSSVPRRGLSEVHIGRTSIKPG